MQSIDLATIQYFCDFFNVTLKKTQGKEKRLDEEVRLSTKGMLYALYKLFQNLRGRKEEIQVIMFNTDSILLNDFQL